MSNELSPYSGYSPMAYTSNPYRSHDLPRRSPEAKQIERSHRRAVARGHELMDEATIVDMTNELNHQLDRNEAHRREQYLADIQMGQARALDRIDTLARGNEARQMELADTYNAWKHGEMYVLQMKAARR